MYIYIYTHTHIYTLPLNLVQLLDGGCDLFSHGSNRFRKP